MADEPRFIFCQLQFTKLNIFWQRPAGHSSVRPECRGAFRIIGRSRRNCGGFSGSGRFPGAVGGARGCCQARGGVFSRSRRPLGARGSCQPSRMAKFLFSQYFLASADARCEIILSDPSLSEWYVRQHPCNQAAAGCERADAGALAVRATRRSRLWRECEGRRAASGRGGRCWERRPAMRTRRRGSTPTGGTPQPPIAPGFAPPRAPWPFA